MVENTVISALADAPEQGVLALNNAHAAELSWLEPGDLRHLIAEAFYAQAVGGCDAFLIAFDQDADYASPNFQWFRARYPRFVYVDRVVVSPAARGLGLARTLYHDLFDRAAAAGHTIVTCEVNSEPPNPASDAFHAALGFLVVGSAAIHDGRKTVRYFSRDL
jgi:predicted GNAT superfamily acetyltransferase